MSPPPPPPLCFPFGGRPRPADDFSSFTSRSNSEDSQPHSEPPITTGPYSPTATLTEKLKFDTDSESYNVPPPPPLVEKRPRSKLVRSSAPVGARRSNTRASAKSATRWGYGWGVGKVKEKELEREPEREQDPPSPDSMSEIPIPVPEPPQRRSSKYSHSTEASGGIGTTGTRSPLHPNESTVTLVGSALERKNNAINGIDPLKEHQDISPRLDDLRNLMQKDNLDYYVIPAEDAHQSEYVASSEKRMEWISGFTGSAGQAIVSKTAAYLITDSRYWDQAGREIEREQWHVVPAGDKDAPSDWIEWIVDEAKDCRIGIDARMISHEQATLLNLKLAKRSSKLVHPLQNLVDLIWQDKPPRSKDPIFLHPMDFAGREAQEKLDQVKEWIRVQPPATPSYAKGPPTPAQIHVATLVTSLASIAYVLNLRGQDIPYNPLFHAYLFIGLERTVLFTEGAKVTDEVAGYLLSLDVERKEYNDIWSFLRRREWGEGKVLIPPRTSYAISLMLTHFRYTVAPPILDEIVAIKNSVELEGSRQAYLRDGAAFVRWLSWLEHKISHGYEITEYEASFRLAEFRRSNRYYKGPAYEPVSASGPNAALPHYSPRVSNTRVIDRETPYVIDSGAQYLDGTCDTTRTLHFGVPTPEQCEAYTRVLQGHIAIDSAVFPEGTSGQQLDVLARRALWKDGLNYLHGTGHGIGSYLTVHEGPHSFQSSVPLVVGHVITNEPGYYQTLASGRDSWGIRIESALAVTRVKTKGQFNGDAWLGFERLTCVPIQTKMIKEGMLTKEEKQWIEEHNQRCGEKLEPLLTDKDDEQALKWLKRTRGRSLYGALRNGPRWGQH